MGSTGPPRPGFGPPQPQQQPAGFGAPRPSFGSQPPALQPLGGFGQPPSGGPPGMRPLGPGDQEFCIAHSSCGACLWSMCKQHAREQVCSRCSRATMLQEWSCAETAHGGCSRRVSTTAAGCPTAGLWPSRGGGARGSWRLRRAAASARRDAGWPGRSGGPAGTPWPLWAAPAAVARCRGAAAAALWRRCTAAALWGALPTAPRCASSLRANSMNN